MMMTFEDYDNKCKHFNDGVMINGRHSYRDFNLYVAARKIEAPERNNVRTSVPHSNGFYDFTEINGAPTYSGRKVSYSFDVVGDDLYELENKRSIVIGWLCSAVNSRIDDDALENFHFIGSLDSISFDDDETGEMTRITADFLCQPFKISNTPNRSELITGSNLIINKGQAVYPTIISTTAGAVTIKNRVISIVPGENRLPVPLDSGENVIVCTAPMTLIYFDEVI